MAAPSPPRLFAAWRVEAFFFSEAFLFGGSCTLHFVSADATPCMNTCLVLVSSLKTQCSRPYGTATCYLQAAIMVEHVNTY